MARTKLALLGLCAVVVGMMAMHASAAQGATLSWLVLNSAHTVATELKAELIGEIDSSSIKLNTEMAGLTPLFTCNAFAFTALLFAAAGQFIAAGAIILAGCVPVNHKGESYKCTVKSTGAPAGTIKSNELKGGLVLVG